MCALLSTSSCVLFGYVLFVALSKTIFDQMDMSMEDIAIREKLGDPTWKTYLMSYFLALFLIIDAAMSIVAMFKSGGSAATAYMAMAVPTLIFMALITLEVIDGNKYIFDKDIFLLSVGLYALSHVALFLFALFSSTEKKVPCVK